MTCKSHKQQQHAQEQIHELSYCVKRHLKSSAEYIQGFCCYNLILVWYDPRCMVAKLLGRSFLNDSSQLVLLLFYFLAFTIILSLRLKAREAGVQLHI